MAIITLKVEFHGSGRYTLTRRTDGGTKIDLKGPLFGNTDAGEFYRAVAKKIAALAKAGQKVIYKDTALDKESN